MDIDETLKLTVPHIQGPLPEGWKAISVPFLDWHGLWQDWSHQGPSVLLDSAGKPSETSRWIILAGKAEKEFLQMEGHPIEKDFWTFLNDIGRIKGADFPFCLQDAWFGALSYEFGRDTHLKSAVVEKRKSKRVPDVYFFKPMKILAFDRLARVCYLWGCDEKQTESGSLPQLFQVGRLEARMGLEGYVKMVEKAKDFIAAGDIYQINLAQAFTAPLSGGDPSGLYRILRWMNPGPFMSAFQGRDFTILSSSPERLVSGRGTRLETRPIAGTRPRNADEKEDERLKRELAENPKEQAEHLMLVDLARNDLGRVSVYGSVKASRYAGVESYSKVHHLVSVVESIRKEESGIGDILKALFPGGTITGCPKIHCMEIIHQLEKEPRGFYTGSLGYAAPGHHFDFNILIRTFTLAEGRLSFSAGAGIVADSNPEREYWETMHKAEALAQSLGTSLVRV